MNAKGMMAALCWLAAATAWGGEAGPPAMTFRELSAANQLGNPRLATARPLISWNRFDIPWSRVEPREGEWNEKEWEKLKTRIREFREAGIIVLPMLGYSTPWAVEPLPFSYTAAGRRHVYELAVDEADGREKVSETVFQAGGKDDGKRLDRKWRPSPQLRRVARDKVPAWQAYVRRVVTELRQPPYNLEYFQLWNEAHPRSGFWNGDMDTYMDHVHRPGAVAVREAGGRVVYGGWPCIATPRQFVEYLDKHDAWDTVDVLSLHYFGPHDLKFVRDAAMKRGRDLPVWATEVGFHRKYLFVPEVYPRTLDMLLSDPAARPGLYRLFFFAWGSPDDPKAYGFNKCLTRGDQFTPHGKALTTLADLFGNHPVAPGRGLYRIADGPGVGDAKEFADYGFRAGARLIVVVHPHGKNTRGALTPEDTYRLVLPGRRLADIDAIERWGVFGEVRELTQQARQEGADVVIDLPLAEDPDQTYVDGDLLPAPENGLRNIFYALVRFSGEV